MSSSISISSGLHIAEVQDALLGWYSRNARDLPWRRHRTPYRVWISEVMLQQTQMERGVAYFLRWMERFPELADLARAGEEEVLAAWEGLGYYSRARNLMKTARFVTETLGGEIPSSEEELLGLPGIGPYTAAAIASIAFGRDCACIDANVDRVLSRLFDIDTPVAREPARSRIRGLARSLLPSGRAGEYNQAMMELGALVCGKRPACGRCPLSDFCLARARGTQQMRPVKEKPRESLAVALVCAVFLCRGRFFVMKRPEGELWGGLWEFPCAELPAGTDPRQAAMELLHAQTGFAAGSAADLGVHRSVFTNHRLSLHGVLLRPQAAAELTMPQGPAQLREWRWVTLKEIGELAMPSAHRKLALSLAKPAAGSLL